MGVHGGSVFRSGQLGTALAASLLALLPVAASAQTATPAANLPQIVVQSGHAADISAAAWTADGAYLLTGSTDRQILIWDLRGRIVRRIALGNGSNRTVVEAIRIDPASGGANVSVIRFKDMFDNGVGSEVWRERYSFTLGDTEAREVESNTVQMPWSGMIDFLAKSLAFKRALTTRTDWPRSTLGWSLTPRNGALAMIPPEAGTRPVALVGPLGPDPDDGDARLEAVAREIEAMARVIAEMGQNPTARPPLAGTAAGDANRREAAYAPRLSPTGSMLAWIERGQSNVLQVLDLERGTVRARANLGRGDAAVPLGWTGPTTVATGLSGGQSIQIDRIATMTPAPGALCPLGTSGELVTPCATPQTDARHVALLTQENGFVHVRNIATGRYLCSGLLDETEVRGGVYIRASADRRWIVMQSALGYTDLFKLNDRLLSSTPPCAPGTDCKTPPRILGHLRQHKCPSVASFSVAPGRIGFHPTRPLLWIEGRGGSIAFHNLNALDVAQDGWSLGTPLFTLYRLPNGRFFVIDARGRYDTNLPPDTDTVRWNVPDAPLQSLAAQTFMRDYYQPGLMRRLLKCSEGGPSACDAQFAPIRPLVEINRVLPQVRIRSVTQGNTPTTAVIEVEIADGVDPTAANGKTRSGVYDLRLFRNNRMAIHFPEQAYAELQERNAAAGTNTPRTDGRAEDGAMRPEAVAEAIRRDIGAWRRLSRIKPDASGKYAVYEFEVEVPTGPDGLNSTFSAYAFNEDRVKSDTAHATWRRPPVTPQCGRTFIVTIGIDAYQSPRLALQFAAGDAALMAKRLGEMPGCDIRRITLEGRKRPDGSTQRVTKLSLQILLGALGGSNNEGARAHLREEGFDVSALDALRPDDVVIISFSGHGWADTQGNFYLLPSDANWPKDANTPVIDTLFSSANLATYLTSWPAREITLIIDACHSAASVDGGDFKPGPMGDAGLGQLAFDKGIRILAATQGDDVAMEDPVLRQGLLTYALASEGIGESGAKADSNGDGRVTLEEWLGYATWRMPTLASDARLGRLSTDSGGARGWVRADAATTRPPVQEPSLFDFNTTPSSVIVREARP